MPHYKNTQEQLFWLDEGDDPLVWLSEDCVEITEEETTIIRLKQQTAPSAAELIQSQITQLEQQQLMPRATREFMLLFMEQSFTPDQLAANFGYQAVKTFDLQIAGLRAELAAL